MSLFGKKKEEKTCGCGCDCGAGCGTEAAGVKTGDSGVKILGGGCAKCNALEAETKAALRRLGMDEEIGHVTDFAEIAAYGVMTTPALVVDGKVVSYGKALKAEEIEKLLSELR